MRENTHTEALARFVRNLSRYSANNLAAGGVQVVWPDLDRTHRERAGRFCRGQATPADRSTSDTLQVAFPGLPGRIRPRATARTTEGSHLMFVDVADAIAHGVTFTIDREDVIDTARTTPETTPEGFDPEPFPGMMLCPVDVRGYRDDLQPSHQSSAHVWSAALAAEDTRPTVSLHQFEAAEVRTTNQPKEAPNMNTIDATIMATETSTTKHGKPFARILAVVDGEAWQASAFDLAAKTVADLAAGEEVRLAYTTNAKTYKDSDGERTVEFNNVIGVLPSA